MKFKSLIYTALASTLLFTSCDLNKQHVFDDNTQAFIAFEGTVSSMSAAESKDGVVTTIQLPIQCASVKGVTASVNFAFTDTAYAENIRAKEGVDYVVKSVVTYNFDADQNPINVVSTDLTAAGAPKVINFDAEHRFATLVLETIDNNEQDGDKKFDVVLTSANGCKLGAFDTFAITVADDENPLNQLLGAYAAHAASAFNGYPDEDWDVVLTADDETEGKIWIHPICLFGGLSAGDIYPVYATVDLAQGIIQMPYGQCVFGGEGQTYNMVTAGLGDQPILSGVNVATFTLGEEVVIEWQSAFGVGNIAANEWYYQALNAPTFTKK